jgi:hypothetical protein
MWTMQQIRTSQGMLLLESRKPKQQAEEQKKCFNEWSFNAV